MPTLQRVPPDSPERCQNTTGVNGQCPYKAEPNSKFCMRHGGNRGVDFEAVRQTRLYKLAKWQSQLEEQADHPNIKSLREEIAILRITLQERLASCQNNWDLMANAGPISELVMKIAALVKSCHKIEKELGQLLDKAQAVRLASEMVTIISNYIDDADMLNAIGEDLARKVEAVINSAHAA